jgi:transcriptional regulator with XRE-family HTH domain
MKRPNLTINDIAKALKVSKSTVSRALRDAHDVNPETKNRFRNLLNGMITGPTPRRKASGAGAPKPSGLLSLPITSRFIPLQSVVSRTTP